MKQLIPLSINDSIKNNLKSTDSTTTDSMIIDSTSKNSIIDDSISADLNNSDVSFKNNFKSEPNDFEIGEIEVEEIQDNEAYFALLSKSYNLGRKIFDDNAEPSTYSEALFSPESKLWLKSLKEEYESLDKNET